MAYSVNKNTEYITYEVQDGDTYASIAEKHKITISEIVSLNDLSAHDLNRIYVGSVLKVGLRDTTTGNVINTGIITDNTIEKAFYDASLQSVSVDTATQAKLDSIKETYRETGTLDSITNDLYYLAGKGYNSEDIKALLNESDIDLSGLDEDLVDETLDKAVENFKNPDTASTGSSYEDSDMSKDTILGLPFRYNVYTDPRRRVYTNTFLRDAPIVSIIPGKPLFRGNTKDSDDSELQEAIKSLFGETYNADLSWDTIKTATAEKFGLGTDDGILNWLQKSQKNNANNGDLRYYRFKDDFLEFLKYLDLNVSTLAVKMGVGDFGAARYKSFMGFYNDDAFADWSHAFKFYCTKSGTSVSESISNEFGDSQIAGTANTVSEALQEFRYLVGDEKANEAIGNVGGKIGEGLSSIISGLFSSLTSGSESEGADNSTMFTSLGDAISAAAGGNKLIWPQIWKNSTFSRSYTLSFEFVSPYGSPEAIFRYVYLPFLTLLTLACPKQYGSNGYSSPFLIRLEMPGFFTSDLAVIQSMQWRKGGNDNLYNNEGLPLAMTVDITVQDLYPSMAMSEDWTALRHNTGMHGFLDNMAGLSVERFSPIDNIKHSLRVKTENIIGSVERNTIGRLKNKVYNITTGAKIFMNNSNQ